MKNLCKIFIAILLLNINIKVDAQQINDKKQKYWFVTFFKHKPKMSLDLTNVHLSENSIALRTKNNIALDSLDLPVKDINLNKLSSLNIKWAYPSRWLNAVLILSDSLNIKQIAAMSFIDYLINVAPEKVFSIGKQKQFSFDEDKRLNKQVFQINEDYHNVFQYRLLGIDNLHREGYTGTDINIAIMDTGMAKIKESIGIKNLLQNDQIKDQYDFVDDDTIVQGKGSEHGTNVLNILGGYAPTLDFYGSAFNANYYMYRTENVDSEYPIEEYFWVVAAERADHIGVDIIQTSLGYRDFSNSIYNHMDTDFNGEKTLISKGVTIASKKGILVVVSAGNEGEKIPRTVAAPADSKEALTVGASSVTSVDPFKIKRAGYSSYGYLNDEVVKPELCGHYFPIVNASTGKHDQGTSFSSPTVAGFAALLKERNPLLYGQRLKEAVMQYGIGDPEPGTCGKGVPFYGSNVHDLVLSLDENKHNFKQFFSLINNGKSEVAIRFMKLGRYELVQYDLMGRFVGFGSINVLQKGRVVNLEYQGHSFLVLKQGASKTTFRIIRE